VLDTRVLITMPTAFITFIMYYTAYIHMVCGLLVMLGLMTRISSLLQLPIVLAAVFVVDIFKSPFNSDMWISVFACVLLGIFTIIGSGPVSLDSYLSKINQK
jgi:putative oxidoreductase